MNIEMRLLPFCKRLYSAFSAVKDFFITLLFYPTRYISVQAGARISRRSWQDVDCKSYHHAIQSSSADLSNSRASLYDFLESADQLVPFRKEVFVEVLMKENSPGGAHET